jgi:uncharacterized integral membrane protein
MTVSALIQQQRQILHALHNAVRQYQQQIAQAQERLERTLEQIQADKAAAEQEAKREYEQARDKYITTILDAELPMSGVKEEHRASREQARAKLRTQLLSAASEKRGALSDIYDTNTIVEHIRKINPQMAVSKTKTKMVAVAVHLISLVLLVISLIGVGYVFFALFSNNSAYFVMGLAIFGVSTVVGILLDRYEKRLSEARKKEHQDELAYLSALYDRWLELITNQTRSRNAEAQQAHQQALEQAKQRFSNSLQQLRPTVLDYTNSADQISPPWQSETWQNWRPGMLTPGVVRLGVFTLQPDQLAVKSATISQSKHLAPGTILGVEIIHPGTAASR